MPALTADGGLRGLALTALGLAMVNGCKSAPPRDSRSRTPVQSIDEAERALADNAQRLNALGIVAPSTDGATSLDVGGGDGVGPSPPPPDDDADAPGDGPEEQPGTNAMAESDSERSVAVTSPESPSSVKATAAPMSGDALSDRCTRVCDLAESTCALAQQICDLAAEHPDQVRYDEACAGATAQCEAASEACDRCE